ncbi:hypothetical protein [Streptomyces zagrosensis]|uniref:Uncharacterized protein n=1 Tax=Streptomyces zagrosensis TaxID=1042984 RepID=A0A7W9Q8B0_9ACTN|nr:hypothetical protein [Streptomyces zagrosensis]MBB5935440.1 hypothetical protein [Streptomyces zagrosensis]
MHTVPDERTTATIGVGPRLELEIVAAPAHFGEVGREPAEDR